MQVSELRSWLQERKAIQPFVDLTEEYLRELPHPVEFEFDEWNLHDWQTRSAGDTRNLYLSKVAHKELKTLTKLHILEKRRSNRIQFGTAETMVKASWALSIAIDSKPVTSVTTSDIYDAERIIAREYGIATASRIVAYLRALANWLGATFGLYLDYSPTLVSSYLYGRHGTEEGREEKLVPDQVVSDMLLSRHREDLIARDRFFLPVFAISVATGFRVSELTSLPADCLLLEGDQLSLLHYPAKGGKPIPRPIHPDLKDLVLDAVETLQEFTQNGRLNAKKLSQEQRLDWSKIVQNREAFRYFTAKWAHEWTSNPKHLMINPRGAWSTRHQDFIDAIGALKAAGDNKSQAARNLGIGRNTFNILLENHERARAGELPARAKVTNIEERKLSPRESWDTDERVLSFMKLEKHASLKLSQRFRDPVRDIIDEAQQLQLVAQNFPAPPFNETFETEFNRAYRPLIKDENGKPLIYPHEALLVLEKYALTDSRSTVEGDFKVVTDKDFSRWLSGEARSRGTGNAEDSCFSRLEIIDPRHEELAKFTNHDIRHWLNTLYQNGGLTDDQVALMFNRKYKSQNAVYDQTSNKVRTERLKNSIRERKALGQITETYHRIAEYSRDEAEAYLQAVTRMVNPMPHGVCTLSWSTNPCPHHLSCFGCDEGGPCEHLEVDTNNQGHIDEITRLAREQDLKISAIEDQGVESSPQLDHAKRVRANVNTFLKRIDAVLIEDNDAN